MTEAPQHFERKFIANVNTVKPVLSGNLSLTNKFYSPENIPQKSI
jgi:hypothetical protein